MVKEKKKTGCLGRLITWFSLLVIIGVVGGIIANREKSSNPQTQVTRVIKSPSTKPKESPIESPAPLPVFNMASVTEIEIPKQVTLKAPETFYVSNGTGSISLPAGASVDVVRRSGEMLTLKFVNEQKELHFSKTTFAEEVIAERTKREKIEQARKDQQARAKKAEEEAEAVKRAIEKALIEKEAGTEPTSNPWKDGEVLAVDRFLKKQLRDPKSTEYIKWSPVMLTDLKDGKAWMVEVKYRSKNAFGGYVIEQGVAFIRHGTVIEYRPTE